MKKLIAILTLITTIAISLTSCNTPTNEAVSTPSEKELTSSDLERKISDLQSQIDEIKGNTSSVESSIPEIDIDLKVLSDKIIAECQPPDGVELVIDTENINDVFNLNKDSLEQNPKNQVDVNKIDDFIRIYNPNPTTPEEVYNIVIVKISDEDTLKSARYNLYDSVSIILKQLTSSFIYSSDESPNKPINQYLYDVIVPNKSDEIKTLIKNSIEN